MLFLRIAALSSGLPLALACLGYEGGIPEATDSISNDAVIEVASGEVFDGLWARYDRGEGACSEQNEGDADDAVFLLHAGATLRNVIIGANQAEGVHCSGPCTLEFVWFEDVCEDAISIKDDAAGDETWIIGGGALIINFYANDYGKVYRSCGNCDSQCQRTVYVEGTTAVDGGEVAGINEAFGDVATLENVCADTDTPCALYDGCEGDCEPEKIGTC